MDNKARRAAYYVIFIVMLCLGYSGLSTTKFLWLKIRLSKFGFVDSKTLIDAWWWYFCVCVRVHFCVVVMLINLQPDALKIINSTDYCFFPILIKSLKIYF